MHSSLKHVVAGAAILVLIAACSRGDGATAVQARRGLPPGSMRAQRVEIMDAGGFEKPMAAAYGLVPVGWTTQGGVQWGSQHMCTNGYALSWSARSPDGAQVIAILPQRSWQATNYPGSPSPTGCPTASITSVQQYLQTLLVQVRPGARDLQFRPRPDLAAKYAYLNSSTPTAMGGMRTWAEAGDLQFTFDEQGREMRGVLTAPAIFSVSRMQAAGMQAMESLNGSALPVFAMSTPRAQFDAKLAEAIRMSFLPNPEWEARVTQHNSAIFRSAQTEIRKQSQAITEANDYISRIRQESAATRAQSDAHRQRQEGEVLRGTQHYDDPAATGGRAELSGYYDNAWRLNDGSYVLSNDAGFEPWRDLGVEGKRLNPTQ